MSELAMSGPADDACLVRSSGSHDVPWSAAQRVAFRFFFSYFVLFGFPFPLDRIPFFGDVVDTVYYDPWQRLAAWVGQLILGHPLLTIPNGESDRSVDFVQNFLVLVAAAVATAIWSVLDRRRADYAKLLAGLRVYVRYMLLFPLFLYAAIKIVKIQFPDPEPDGLLQMYGDSQPGKLLWMFMSHSHAYSALVGIAEVVAGLLLCFRRTATLGALIAAATLLNVVMLNVCFNVGVKLWSANLLVMAVFLLGLDARRLGDVFVFHRPTQPDPPALPSSPFVIRWLDERWAKRGRRAAKALVIGLATLAAVTPVLKYRKPPPHALFGIYEVESFARNGELLPLVITDANCWRGVVINTYGHMTIRFMDERSDRYPTKTDPAKQTLALRTWDNDESKKTVLTYAQPDLGHLTLAGLFSGEKVEVRLRKVERKFRLREERFRLSFDGPIESKR
jgi:hypothetical protein